MSHRVITNYLLISIAENQMALTQQQPLGSYALVHDCDVVVSINLDPGHSWLTLNGAVLLELGAMLIAKCWGCPKGEADL